MHTIPYEIISLLKNTKPPSILMQFPELLEISAQPVPGLPVHISTMTMAFLEFNKILNDSCINCSSGFNHGTYIVARYLQLVLK